MARGAGALIPLAVAAVVGLVILASLAAVLGHGGAASVSAADWAAVRFTVGQAAVSAALSCVLAIPVARALTRRRFAGRQAIIALLGAPFLLPVITAVFGVVAIYGRSGVLNRAFEAVGLPAFSLYGPQGVVLAQVFLNMPLAVRMMLNGWAAIPAERLRLAGALGFGPGAVWRHLEKPMLATVLPGAALAIFVICLTSFAVALTLGGGPDATTVELSIYQAIRYEFDLPKAALLAAVQFGLCAAALALTWAATGAPGFGAGLDRAALPPAPRGWRRPGDALAVGLALVFVASPLVAVLGRGLWHLTDLPPQIWQAAGRSILIALPSGVLATAGALALALAPNRWAEGVAMLPLAASSLVIGTGLFLLLVPPFRPGALALPVTLAVNAALTLPFAYRALRPEALALRADYGRLTEALGIAGWARLRRIILPRLRRPLGFAMGVTVALSMGDLGVIALFADERSATLPLMVQRLMGAYRMDQAAAAALVLAGLGFSAFLAFDLWGRRNADA
ncbi:thiamine/thiamine pyrophosphate ABC transporter permease ThiP [Aliigemmobacter aestuarii]|uniref:Thiamine/thiamine pyrophosphate ABC transporter permease ThiP n=1 Tax=Aliigemmobacter aestuarii TaxID=1445661 RepID=A0A4S3MV81_9RHOB|nr:thiamine/thiamine pyrophosphate ABC transporter permease ThiP [Gemmobacter aestuarii]THD85471.1 thiamine/thiamine pyrophosphate ABC transporter permease ThiP [Gemmobacter aestuarii]